MFGMDPKQLRAEARRLTQLARTIEMAADPKKYVKKKVNAKANGAKRKVRNDILKKMGL